MPSVFYRKGASRPHLSRQRGGVGLRRHPRFPFARGTVHSLHILPQRGKPPSLPFRKGCTLRLVARVLPLFRKGGSRTEKTSSLSFRKGYGTLAAYITAKGEAALTSLSQGVYPAFSRPCTTSLSQGGE